MIKKHVATIADKSGRCLKCGGYLTRGGVRFANYAPDIERCVNCGLSNESAYYMDCINNKMVKI